MKVWWQRDTWTASAQWLLAVGFEWRDMWVGLYVDPHKGGGWSAYFCPVPTVVVRLQRFTREGR